MTLSCTDKSYIPQTGTAANSTGDETPVFSFHQVKLIDPFQGTFAELVPRK